MFENSEEINHQAETGWAYSLQNGCWFITIFFLFQEKELARKNILLRKLCLQTQDVVFNIDLNL